MTIPVKTLLLNAIVAAVSAINEIETVIKNPSKPVDRDVLKMPASFVFDEQDTLDEERNRIDICSFPLHIEVWIEDKSPSAGDTADLIDAEVYKNLITDIDVLHYSMRVNKVSAEKLFVDEFTLCLVLIYTVTYAYKHGDPYDLVRT